MIGFVALKPTAYSYLMDGGNSIKKLKEQESVIKRILKFNHYKKCLFKNKIILKLQQKFKSETHNVYAEEINKVALGSHDDNNNDDIKNM